MQKMILSYLMTISFFIFSFNVSVAKTSLETSDFLLNKNIWRASPAQFEKKYRKHSFVWLTEKKNSLRAHGVGQKTFGVPSGEILASAGKLNKMARITVSIFNKGDNKAIDAKSLREITLSLEKNITEATKVTPEKKVKKGLVKMRRKIWILDHTVLTLEESVNAEGGAEFLVLKATSLKANKNVEKTVNRSSLKNNVEEDRATFDVYIKNIPMIDQGQKGYCACATAARIYQYYGRSITQHKIAQIAGSSASRGTSIISMVEALKNASMALGSRLLIFYEYPKYMTNLSDSKKHESAMKEIRSDLNSYQKIARKEKARSFPVPNKRDYSRIGKNQHIRVDEIFKSCDPRIFRDVMKKKSSFRRWKKKVINSIDEGIPIAWALNLGIFTESYTSLQAKGGHMRLIIGYNAKTNKIIYSDSWGAGHEKKYMDMGNAFTITSIALTVPPSK